MKINPASLPPRYQQQVAAQLATSSPAPAQAPQSDGMFEDETDLQRLCCQFLEYRQWPYICPRMDVPTTIGRGVADITAFLPEGKTLHAECKSRHGTQQPEQLKWQMKLEKNGHVYVLVWTLDQFKAAADAVAKGKPMAKKG